MCDINILGNVKILVRSFVVDHIARFYDPGKFDGTGQRVFLITISANENDATHIGFAVMEYLIQ